MVNAVAFDPKRKLLATASADATVRFWDTATGQPHGLPLTAIDVVNAVAFSPEGKLLVTASADATVRLWNLTDPAAPLPLGAPLTSHTDVVLGGGVQP